MKTVKEKITWKPDKFITSAELIIERSKKKVKKKDKLDALIHYYEMMKKYHLHTYKYWKICIERGIPIEGDKNE